MNRNWNKLILLTLAFLLLNPFYSSAYEVWFTYETAHLPYTINVLPTSNTYSGWDEWMSSRWNIYADIFNRFIDRYTSVFNDGYNDQVDPFLDDAGFNSYYSTSGGWGNGAAVTGMENCGTCTNDTSDIAYNVNVNWKTDKTVAGKLFQGSAIHELGHAIGIHHNFEGMSVMNYGHPDAIDDHLMPDDVAYLYNTFPTKAKVVTDMGVYAYHDNGPQSFAPATATPNLLYRGANLRVDGMYVGNLSNQDQTGSAIGFYLSADTAITTSDKYMGAIYFPSAWPRASGYKYDDINFTVPSDTAAGTFYVGMIIKANGVDTDSVTYNNTAFLETPITVCTTAVPPIFDPGTSVNAGVNYTVSWSSVGGATSYTVCEAPNSGFTGETCVNAGASTSRVYTHTNCSTETYYYRVRAETPCGSNAYSTSASTMQVNALPVPGVPPIYDPGNSAASGAGYPVTWSAVSTATSYSVCEATNSSFTGETCVNTGVSTANFYMHTVSSNTFYYYRVRALNGCWAGSYSTVPIDMLVVAPCGMQDIMRTTQSGTSYHSSITAAYTAANNSGDSLWLHAIYFAENPTFTLNKSLVLHGGYDCNYSSADQYSRIDGMVTVTSGQITFDRIIIL